MTEGERRSQDTGNRGRVLLGALIERGHSVFPVKFLGFILFFRLTFFPLKLLIDIAVFLQRG